MVLYYEQNSYMKIDARDGREWDALLRASFVAVEMHERNLPKMHFKSCQVCTNFE